MVILKRNQLSCMDALIKDILSFPRSYLISYSKTCIISVFIVAILVLQNQNKELQGSVSGRQV